MDVAGTASVGSGHDGYPSIGATLTHQRSFLGRTIDHGRIDHLADP
jgi:hypothetical protein